jgi:hypothetical protein
MSVLRRLRFFRIPLRCFGWRHGDVSNSSERADLAQVAQENDGAETSLWRKDENRPLARSTRSHVHSWTLSSQNLCRKNGWTFCGKSVSEKGINPLGLIRRLTTFVTQRNPARSIWPWWWASMPG